MRQAHVCFEIKNVRNLQAGRGRPLSPKRRQSIFKLRIATYVSLGVTAAAGAGLAVTGVLALRADDDLQTELDRYPGEAGDIRDARDRRDQLSTTSNVMLGVTAVLAAVTVGLGVATVVTQRREESSSARAGLRPGGFVLRF